MLTNVPIGTFDVWMQDNGKQVCPIDILRSAPALNTDASPAAFCRLALR